MKIKVGDTIKCHDAEDMVDTAKELLMNGIETDFDYSDGLHLIVVK